MSAEPQSQPKPRVPTVASGFPTLSVVVPNYNHARFLPVCLDAILAQSVQASEIIVVDDGSTDDSLAILNRYAAGHPSVRVLALGRNGGVVAAMNAGLALATGEYLHFAGADDEVMPGLFEKSLGLLAKHPGAGLCCTISRWNDVSTGVQWLVSAGMADAPGYLSPDELVALEQRGRLMIVSHSAVLRANVVRELGGFLPELRWHCDWWVTYAAAFRHGLCFVPEALSQVNLHGSSYYGAGHRRDDHDRVMDRLLERLHEERHADIGVRVRASGALALHSVPMLRAMLRTAAHRDFLTARFVRKCLWRWAQVVGRRHFPPWLARWCVRLLPGQR